MKPNHTLRNLLTLAGSSLMAMSSAHAQTDLTWDITPGTVGVGDNAITGGTGTWNTTNGNWTADGGANNIAWTNGDNAFIIGAANMTIDGAITAGTLSFTSGGVAGRTLSGSEITINGGMYLERLSSLTWNAPIKLGGSQTWTHDQKTANSTGKSMAGGTNLDGYTLTWDTTNVQSNNRITHQNITGTGSIIKDGTGWLGLGGTNTYTGSTTINAGTIDMASAGALGNANNNLTINTGGTLNMGSRGLTVGNLTGTGGLITNSNTFNPSATIRISTLTIGNGDATGGNFQGVIEDGTVAVTTTALTKIGNGTLTLSGDNTYTGATSVSAGTLLIDGDSSLATGNVTVASGATLGGGGTIGGGVSVSGAIAPGSAGIGTLNTGAVTWNSGNDWQFELGASNAADKLSITGNFTKGSGSSFVFDFLNSAALGTFTLVSWTGTTDFLASDFSDINYGGAFGGSFSITSATNGSLLFTAIPEPSTALAGILLGLGLLRRRRSA